MERQRKSSHFAACSHANKPGLVDPRSLACETPGILCISAAFVSRDFWILANQSSTDHHAVLVVVENQSVRRVSRLLSLFDDAQRIVVEILLTVRAGAVPHPGNHKKSHGCLHGLRA